MAATGSGHGPSSRELFILISSFLNLLLNSSIGYNAGVLNIVLVDTFDLDPVDVSWLMSFYSTLYALAAPLGSVVINLTNCQTCVTVSGILGLVGFVVSGQVQSLPMLYLSLGLAGVGHALCQSGSVLVLSYYFPLSLPVVHGVCLAGSGLGCFLHPVLTQILFDTYGYKSTMMMLGGLMFHSAALGLLLKPTDLEKRCKSGGKNNEKSTCMVLSTKLLPPIEIFKVPAFSAILPAIFLNFVAFQSMVVSLPSYINRCVGLSPQEGSVAAMVFGAGSVSSRLLAGMAASDERIGEMLLFFGMSGMLSVLSFCGGPIMQVPQGVYVFSFLFGLYSGGSINLISSMNVAMLGVERAHHGFGCMMMVTGVAGLVGPPVIAVLIENHGAAAMFVSCGVICLICMAFGLLAMFLQHYHTVTQANGTFSQVAKDVTLDLNVEAPLMTGNDVAMSISSKSPEKIQHMLLDP